jgi:hypothetical protein
MLTRLSRRLFGFRPAFTTLFTATLISFLPVTTTAQRGAGMGRPAGGAHFASAMHMAAPARRSPHLTYQAPYRNIRSVSRNSRGYLFTANRFLRPNAFGFRSAFGFRRNRFYWGYGYWPFWAWDSSDWNDCYSYGGNCKDDPGPYTGSIESSDDSDRPMITVYLRDGSGYGATDYWVSNSVLHIQTTYGALKTFPIGEVDLERTGRENAEQGINFTFHTLPMVSDPGPALAPDSYAPACPAVSVASQRGGAGGVSSGSSADAGSWFGATGSASQKGLAVGSVRAGSPAAEAGLQVGDVVVRVDCQPIRTAQDMDQAFRASSGTVWVSYLIQGSWMTDKKVVR